MPGTRVAIVEAGKRLQARGQRPTVTAVAREAGLSRSTLYRVAGSQEGLLDLLQVEPDPGSRERVLEVAMQMVGRHGLAALSMDELAAAAGVSRANLYRLFPGKSALFRELMRSFSPMEQLAENVARLAGQPPQVVVPALYGFALEAFSGRAGILRTLFYELTSGVAETQGAGQFALQSGIGAVLGYLAAEMEAGRLRRVPPVIALQAFAGPLLIHIMTRDLLARVLGVEIEPEAAASALAEHYLRAMTPEEMTG